MSQIGKHSRVLDVGCGIGGTSRYLAKNMGCDVVGITISGQQVQIGKRLTAREAGVLGDYADWTDSFKIGDGGVQLFELDAEKLGSYFYSKTDFDCVWIAEAMSHLPDKELFFHNAYEVLAPEGKLVIADWFRAEVLTDTQIQTDIRPIEGTCSLDCSESREH